MDWHVFWSALVGALGGTAALFTVLLYFGDKWLRAHIEQSVQTKYQKALEDHRAKLQAQAKETDEREATDRATFRRLLNALPPTGSIDLVRRVDFGRSSFVGEQLEQLTAFSITWSRPEYLFLDEDLNAKLKGLALSAGEFLDQVGKNVFTVPGKPDQYQVLWEKYSENPTEFTRVSDDINSKATCLVAAYDDLLKTAHRKLRC